MLEPLHIQHQPHLDTGVLNYTQHLVVFKSQWLPGPLYPIMIVRSL